MLAVPMLAPLALACVSDPERTILARRGEFASASQGERARGGGHVENEVALVSSSGLAVELTLRGPDGGGGELAARSPLVVLLGGHDTGRKAARLIPDTHGVVVAALSYPTDVSRIGGLGDALAVRRAVLDTPAALLLALDWLLAQPFADPARVELVGVSLGAPFVCVAGALDPRVRRVWAIHGGGSPAKLISHALADELWSPCAWVAGRMIAGLAHGWSLAPERWVPRLAPRELVMVNALDDESIPRECVELLYDAAREPKRQLWRPGGHIDKDDEERIRELCALVVGAIQRDEVPR